MREVKTKPNARIEKAMDDLSKLSALIRLIANNQEHMAGDKQSADDRATCLLLAEDLTEAAYKRCAEHCDLWPATAAA